MNGGQSCPGNDTETARACYTPCPGKFASRLTLFAIGSKKRDYIFDLIWIWFKHQILLRFYLGWLLGLLLLFGLTSQVMLKFDRKLYKGYTFLSDLPTTVQFIAFFIDRFFRRVIIFDPLQLYLNMYVFLPVDGGFDLWSAWTTCSQTCGTGTQSRNRTCTNPIPANQGQNCSGEYDQAKSCKLTSCPGNSLFSLLIYMYIQR